MVTQAQCNNGASQLGKKSGPTIPTHKIYPAGCFIYGEKVYFNTDINPSRTLPASDFRGLCFGGIAILFEYYTLDTFSFTYTYFLHIKKGL